MAKKTPKQFFISEQTTFNNEEFARNCKKIVQMETTLLQIIKPFPELNKDGVSRFWNIGDGALVVDFEGLAIRLWCLGKMDAVTCSWIALPPIYHALSSEKREKIVCATLDDDTIAMYIVERDVATFAEPSVTEEETMTPRKKCSSIALE